MFEEKMFSEKDQQQILEKGISMEQIASQIGNFRTGFRNTPMTLSKQYKS